MNQLKKENPNALVIVEADLLTEGSFDKAVENSEIVFHTASPCTFNTLIITYIKVFFVPPDQKEEAEQKLVKVAVDGTNNVLSSVTRVGKAVKRVVLTSSVAAVVNPLKPHSENITDDDWNENSSMDGKKS